MTDKSHHMPADWKPSEETFKKLEDMGYTKEYLRSQWIPWKQKIIAYQQKYSYKSLSKDCDYRFLRDMIETDPARAEVPKKKRIKIHNPATDPEENKKLNKKLEEIESIDMENSAKRLAKLRAEIGL